MASLEGESCHDDSNFAVICSFVLKFGGNLGINMTIAELQEMLEDTKNVPDPLIDLMVRLLRRCRKWFHRDKWEKAMIKFCHEYASVDAWELERFGFKKAKLSVKLELLKRLLELQFDGNAKFKLEVNKQEAMDLRLLPLGRDLKGHTYWFQRDEEMNLRLYQEEVEEENSWKLLCKSRAELCDLLQSLQQTQGMKSARESSSSNCSENGDSNLPSTANCATFSRFPSIKEEEETGTGMDQDVKPKLIDTGQNEPSKPLDDKSDIPKVGEYGDVPNKDTSSTDLVVKSEPHEVPSDVKASPADSLHVQMEVGDTVAERSDVGLTEPEHETLDNGTLTSTNSTRVCSDSLVPKDLSIDKSSRDGGRKESSTEKLSPPLEISNEVVPGHSKEVVLEHSKEVVPEKSREVVLEQSKTVVPELLKQVVLEHSKEVVSKGMVSELSQEVVPEHSKEMVGELSEKVVPEHLKDVVPEIPKEVVPEIFKEVVPEQTKENIRETFKDGILDSSKEVDTKLPIEAALISAAEKCPKEGEQDSLNLVVRERLKDVLPEKLKEVVPECSEGMEQDSSKEVPKNFKEIIPETLKEVVPESSRLDCVTEDSEKTEQGENKKIEEMEVDGSEVSTLKDSKTEVELERKSEPKKSRRMKHCESVLSDTPKRIDRKEPRKSTDNSSGLSGACNTDKVKDRESKISCKSKSKASRHLETCNLDETIDHDPRQQSASEGKCEPSTEEASTLGQSSNCATNDDEHVIQMDGEGRTEEELCVKEKKKSKVMKDSTSPKAKCNRKRSSDAVDVDATATSVDTKDKAESKEAEVESNLSIPKLKIAFRASEASGKKPQACLIKDTEGSRKDVNGHADDVKKKSLSRKERKRKLASKEIADSTSGAKFSTGTQPVDETKDGEFDGTQVVDEIEDGDKNSEQIELPEDAVPTETKKEMEATSEDPLNLKRKKSKSEKASKKKRKGKSDCETNCEQEKIENSHEVVHNDLENNATHSQNHDSEKDRTKVSESSEKADKQLAGCSEHSSKINIKPFTDSSSQSKCNDPKMFTKSSLQMDFDDDTPLILTLNASRKLLSKTKESDDDTPLIYTINAAARSLFKKAKDLGQPKKGTKKKGKLESGPKDSDANSRPSRSCKKATAQTETSPKKATNQQTNKKNKTPMSKQTTPEPTTPKSKSSTEKGDKVSNEMPNSEAPKKTSRPPGKSPNRRKLFGGRKPKRGRGRGKADKIEITAPVVETTLPVLDTQSTEESQDCSAKTDSSAGLMPLLNATRGGGTGSRGRGRGRARRTRIEMCLESSLLEDDSNMGLGEGGSSDTSPRKRSARIQTQQKKKRSELAEQLEIEQRQLELLAKDAANKKPEVAVTESGELKKRRGRPKKIHFLSEFLQDQSSVGGPSFGSPLKPKGKKKDKDFLHLIEDEDEEEDGDEEDSQDWSLSSKGNGQQFRKKRRHRKRKKKGNMSAKPWEGSSGSSSTEEEVIEEEEDWEDREEEEEKLKFDENDDEFACEEAEEGEPVKLRRARTLRRVVSGSESDGENRMDDRPCGRCGQLDHPEWILLCDRCDSGYHASCLKPPLMVIPSGDWFCPPCEHTMLCDRLGDELKELDNLLKKKEREDLRKQRLAYVGISLDNVLKTEKKENAEVPTQEEPQEPLRRGTETEENSSEEDKENDPRRKKKKKKKKEHYLVRSSRQRTAVSYRFQEYDELIASALQAELGAAAAYQKELAAAQQASTVDQPAPLEVAAEPTTVEVAPVILPPTVTTTEAVEAKTGGEKDRTEEEEEEEEEEEVLYAPVVKKTKLKKKKKPLGVLTSSEDDDNDVKDQDYQGSSGSDTEMSRSKGSFEEEESSNSDWQTGGRRGRRGRGSDSGSDTSEYRPSTRRGAQKKVISYKEDSSDEDYWEPTKAQQRAKKRKKKSDSEDSDRDFDDDDDDDDRWRKAQKKDEAKRKKVKRRIKRYSDSSDSSEESAGSTKLGRKKVKMDWKSEEEEESEEQDAKKKKKRKISSSEEEPNEQNSSEEESEEEEEEECKIGSKRQVIRSDDDDEEEESKKDKKVDSKEPASVEAKEDTVVPKQSDTAIPETKTSLPEGEAVLQTFGKTTSDKESVERPVVVPPPQSSVIVSPDCRIQKAGEPRKVADIADEEEEEEVEEEEEEEEYDEIEEERRTPDSRMPSEASLEQGEMAQDLTMSKQPTGPPPRSYSYPTSQQPSRGFPPEHFAPAPPPPQPSSDLTPLVEDYSNRPSPLKPSIVETGIGGSYPSSPSKLTSLDNPPSFTSNKLTPLGQYPPSNYRHTPSPRFSHHSPDFQRNSDSHYRPQGNFPAYPTPQGQYCGPPGSAPYGRSPPPSPYPVHGPSSPSQEDYRGAPYPPYPPSYPVYPGQGYYPPGHHPPPPPHNVDDGQPSGSGPPYPPHHGNYLPPNSGGPPPPSHGGPYPYYGPPHQPNGGFMIDNLLRSRNPEGGEEDDLTGVTDIVSYITQE